uniref:Omp28-related outer membrane protein n=1 Tax=Alistipes sp. TaxID=1872444 RepID=UPI0040574A63
MKKLFRLLLLALPFLTISCDIEGPSLPEAGEIKLSKTLIEVSSEYSTNGVSINAPYAWLAQTSESWISILQGSGDAGDGMLRFSVSKNESSQSRQGTITITTSDYNLSAELSVVQMGGEAVLLLEVDNSFIYDNGGADENGIATFTLTLNGNVVTEGYTIYEGMDTPLDGNTFTSTEQGTYRFWAAYGVDISNVVSVNVVKTPSEGPDVPKDNNPSKTNFVRRVLLTQFTGTGCGYCPNMMNALHQLAASDKKDKYIVAAAHLFNESDPAYLTESPSLDSAMGVNSYPNMIADLNKNAKSSASYASLVSLVNNAQSRVTVKGGIAVNSEYDASKGVININALVKAKESAEFRIGAWLLEDNIKANQSNYGITPVAGLSDFNTHHNCVRIADSKNSNSDFSGFSLGTIEAGKTALRKFSFELKSNGTGGKNNWNHDNLRVIVFISTKEGDSWYVNNVVKAPKSGSVDFEYTE